MYNVFEADDYCKKHYNGSLLTVNSLEEEQFITDWLYNDSKTKRHITCDALHPDVVEKGEALTKSMKENYVHMKVPDESETDKCYTVCWSKEGETEYRHRNCDTKMITFMCKTVRKIPRVTTSRESETTVAAGTKTTQSLESKAPEPTAAKTSQTTEATGTLEAKDKTKSTTEAKTTVTTEAKMPTTTEAKPAVTTELKTIPTKKAKIDLPAEVKTSTTTQAKIAVVTKPETPAPAVPVAETTFAAETSAAQTTDKTLPSITTKRTLTTESKTTLETEAETTLPAESEITPVFVNGTIQWTGMQVPLWKKIKPFFLNQTTSGKVLLLMVGVGAFGAFLIGA